MPSLNATGEVAPSRITIRQECRNGRQRPEQIQPYRITSAKNRSRVRGERYAIPVFVGSPRLALCLFGSKTPAVSAASINSYCAGILVRDWFRGKPEPALVVLPRGAAECKSARHRNIREITTFTCLAAAAERRRGSDEHGGPQKTAGPKQLIPPRAVQPTA